MKKKRREKKGKHVFSAAVLVCCILLLAGTVSSAAMAGGVEAAEGQEEDAGAADREAAEKVQEMILNLPGEDYLTPQDQAAVEAAGEAYNALTDTQKALVSKDTLDTLKKLEEKLLAWEDDSVTLTCKNYPVSVTGKGLAGLTLKVEALGASDSDVEKMRKKYTKTRALIRLYRVRLYEGDKSVQPPQEISMAVRVGTSYDGNTLNVLHMKDGSVSTLSGKASGGVLTVKTETLGKFAVAVNASTVSDSAVAAGSGREEDSKNKTPSQGNTSGNGSSTGGTGNAAVSGGESGASADSDGTAASGENGASGKTGTSGRVGTSSSGTSRTGSPEPAQAGASAEETDGVSEEAEPELPAEKDAEALPAAAPEPADGVQVSAAAASESSPYGRTRVLCLSVAVAVLVVAVTFILYQKKKRGKGKHEKENL